MLSGIKKRLKEKFYLFIQYFTFFLNTWQDEDRTRYKEQKALNECHLSQVNISQAG